MTHNRPTNAAERSPDARTPLGESRAPSEALSEPHTGAQPSALRDRIAQALWPLTDWDGDQLNAERAADAVLAVLPDHTAVRAAALNEAADVIEREQAREETEERAKFGSLDHETELQGTAVRDKSAQLRRMADCPACDAGIEHTEHCPTPETHNWGCGCPSDVAAAIASCPGREMSPSPCRCPCYGCKHNCAAHQPAAARPDDTTGA